MCLNQGRPGMPSGLSQLRSTCIMPWFSVSASLGSIFPDDNLRVRESFRCLPAASKASMAFSTSLKFSRVRLRGRCGGGVGILRLRRCFASRTSDSAQDDKHVLAGEFIYELADVAGVAGEVEGEQVGVREAQGRHAPELAHQRVVFVAGIAEVVHPVEIVVGGVVDAVVSVEPEAEDGHADEVEEDGMVGAAADAGVGEAVVDDAGGTELAGLIAFRFLAGDGFFPRVVETFS